MLRPATAAAGAADGSILSLKGMHAALTTVRKAADISAYTASHCSPGIGILTSMERDDWGLMRTGYLTIPTAIDAQCAFPLPDCIMTSALL